MATWDDVRAIADALPEVSETPERTWRVRGRAFVLERPLRVADRAHLGDLAPVDPPMAIHVADLGVKEALLGAEPDVYFTTPHFDGYAAVLARLDALGTDELREVVVDSWLCRAPRRLARAWLAEHPSPDDGYAAR
ncbi:MmcQ/YjbR family DNA-binding protein [Cellulomonas aerilata]|uniref:MmcQ/YjbR family DNA-binding protein n=1 Tax=Cellulomonas aerilata TaxID=515326 RepID=A0A512DCR3_9CELL|nr:MmcQ/YjbR family DNA-binding protein [Cellulomonas aerilata]GEO34253.1 hypothetical protein CAE01nite_19780 [Cellulomonas aerilata]